MAAIIERENARNYSATAICSVCNKRFARGRRQNQHRRSHAAFTAGRYCSDACRQAAYRARCDIRDGIPRSQRALRNRNKRRLGAKVRATVTRPEISQQNQCAATCKKTGLAPAFRPHRPLPALPPNVVLDARYPNMYRLRRLDGSLSDIVNLTRAKDALAEMRGAS